MVKMSVGIEIPKFRFVAINGAETVQAMAEAVADKATSRLSRGAGALGQLPKPKAGGKPLNQTGALLNSIKARASRKNPERWLVAATGPRGTKAEIKGKRSRARVERKRRKAEGIKGRVRPITTNAALLAVLRNPPKDKRAAGGNRAVYRVLEKTPAYELLARDVATRKLRYRLESDGVIEMGKK